MDSFEGAKRAGLHTAGFLPAIIEQVRAKSAFLRRAHFIVPTDGAEWAGVCQGFVPNRFPRVQKDDAVGAFDGATGRILFTGGIVAVVAKGGAVGEVHPGQHAAFPLLDNDPFLVAFLLLVGIGQPFVAYMLILAGEHAGIASYAFVGVKDDMPPFHFSLHTVFMIAAMPPQGVGTNR
jgi:hypothetical protein